jgi:short-subunit dehydrogenase
MLAAAAGRDIDLLFANAGHGLGGAFLEQDPAKWRHVIDTNVTGTSTSSRRSPARWSPGTRAHPHHRVHRRPHRGAVPGRLQRLQGVHRQLLRRARHELKETEVTVTCLKPGATETEFFHRAEMDDTNVGSPRRTMRPTSRRLVMTP